MLGGDVEEYIRRFVALVCANAKVCCMGCLLLKVLKVCSAQCLNRFMVTRAHAPRQVISRMRVESSADVRTWVFISDKSVYARLTQRVNDNQEFTGAT